MLVHDIIFVPLNIKIPVSLQYFWLFFFIIVLLYVLYKFLYTLKSNKKIVENIVIIIVVLCIYHLFSMFTFLPSIIETSWITADMGWCRNWGSGLRMFGVEIFREINTGEINICV